MPGRPGAAARRRRAVDAMLNIHLQEYNAHPLEVTGENGFLRIPVSAIFKSGQVISPGLSVTSVFLRTASRSVSAHLRIAEEAIKPLGRITSIRFGAFST